MTASAISATTPVLSSTPPPRFSPPACQAGRGASQAYTTARPKQLVNRTLTIDPANFAQWRAVGARRGIRMTDVTAGQGAGGATGTPRESPGFQLPRFADIAMLFRRGDIALAVGILVILMLLILPLPPLLLDFSLAVSIIFSVLILMTALFIQAP